MGVTHACEGCDSGVITDELTPAVESRKQANRHRPVKGAQERQARAEKEQMI